MKVHGIRVGRNGQAVDVIVNVDVDGSQKFMCDVVGTWLFKGGRQSFVYPLGSVSLAL